MAIPSDDLQHLDSRITLKSTKVLVHLLSVGECTLQGESNRLCSYEVCCRVDNHDVEVRIVSARYTLSLSIFVGTPESSKVFEYRNVEMMFICVGFEGASIRVSSRRIFAAKFVLRVDILVSSKFDNPCQIRSSLVEIALD